MSISINNNTNGFGLKEYKKDQLEGPFFYKIAKFALSLLWGTEGTYEWRGNTVRFEGHPLSGDASVLAKACYLFDKLIKQPYLYTFVHEVGHGIAYKFADKNPGRVEIVIRKNYEGDFSRPDDPEEGWLCFKETVVGKNIYAAAGPLTSVAFASFMFRLGIKLNKYPFFAFLLGAGASGNVYNEIRYFLKSSLARDSGDWGTILRRDKTHHAVASALFLIIILLGFTDASERILSRFK